MGKNRMPEVAKMLGIELNEEFKVEILGDIVTYHFSDKGLRCEGVAYYCSDALRQLLNGEIEIIKMPWEPKDGDTYCYVDRDGGIGIVVYNEDYSHDRAMYKSGNCFRTKEEITPEVISKIMKEFYEMEA